MLQKIDQKIGIISPALYFLLVNNTSIVYFCFRLLSIDQRKKQEKSFEFQTDEKPILILY